MLGAEAHHCHDTVDLGSSRIAYDDVRRHVATVREVTGSETWHQRPVSCDRGVDWLEININIRNSDWNPCVCVHTWRCRHRGCIYFLINQSLFIVFESLEPFCPTWIFNKLNMFGFWWRKWINDQWAEGISVNDLSDFIKYNIRTIRWYESTGRNHICVYVCWYETWHILGNIYNRINIYLLINLTGNDLLPSINIISPPKKSILARL